MIFFSFFTDFLKLVTTIFAQNQLTYIVDSPFFLHLLILDPSNPPVFTFRNRKLSIDKELKVSSIFENHLARPWLTLITNREKAFALRVDDSCDFSCFISYCWCVLSRRRWRGKYVWFCEMMKMFALLKRIQSHSKKHSFKMDSYDGAYHIILLILSKIGKE